MKYQLTEGWEVRREGEKEKGKEGNRGREGMIDMERRTERREGEERVEREIFHLLVHFPKAPQRQSQQLHLGLSHEWQRTEHSRHDLPPSRHISRKLNQP